jgi:hypothetical protein
MSDSWRTATITADISGASLFQTAFTDANGEITSFTSGDNEIRKYWKSSTLEVIYKKIVPPLLFSSGTSIKYSDDGYNFTNLTVAIGSSNTPAAPRKIGNKWFTTAYDYGETKLYSSTDLSTWTEAKTNCANSFGGSGNTIVVKSTTSLSEHYHYSTDGGATWNESGNLGFTISQVAYFGGKIIVLFMETDEFSPYKIGKVKVLEDFADTTGTNYTVIASEATYDEMFATSPVESNGKLFFTGTSGSYMTTTLYEMQNTTGTIIARDSYSSTSAPEVVSAFAGKATATKGYQNDSFISSDAVSDPADVSTYLSSWIGQDGSLFFHFVNSSAEEKIFKHNGIAWIDETSLFSGISLSSPLRPSR